MSKELTPLEALHSFDHWIQVEFAEQFKIIETALKDYEQLKIVAKPLTNEEKKSINNVAKRLKALEAIKKQIVRFSFKHGGIMGNVIELQIGCDTCYLHFNENDKNFDLLKEVLK